MTTIQVKDGGGVIRTVARVADTGTAEAVDCLPVTLSVEDKATQADVLASLVSLLAQGGPRYTAATIITAATDVTGTAFVAFGAQACAALDLVNTHPDSVDIEVRRGGSGPTIPVPAGSTRLFVGVTNANELQIRRIDMGVGVVTVAAEALS